MAGHIWKVLRCEIFVAPRIMEKPDYFHANGLLIRRRRRNRRENMSYCITFRIVSLLFPRNIYLLIAIIIYKQFFSQYPPLLRILLHFVQGTNIHNGGR